MQSRPIIKHFRMTQDVARAIRLSSGDFEDSAICGNGGYHAYLTTDTSQVDCVECARRAKSFRRIGAVPAGPVYVVVHYNGWFLSIRGIAAPVTELREVSPALADAVRPAVKEICADMGYADLSTL